MGEKNRHHAHATHTSAMETALKALLWEDDMGEKVVLPFLSAGEVDPERLQRYIDDGYDCRPPPPPPRRGPSPSPLPLSYPLSAPCPVFPPPSPSPNLQHSHPPQPLHHGSCRAPPLPSLLLPFLPHEPCYGVHAGRFLSPRPAPRHSRCSMNGMAR